MKIEIDKLVKTVFFSIFFIMLNNLSIYADEIPEGESKQLEVNITTERGQGILMKEGSAFICANPLIFTLPADCQCFYSLSIDGGRTFGGYVKMESSSITLYPDRNLSLTNDFAIRFKGEKHHVQKNAEGEEENVIVESVSQDYKISFDDIIPDIKVNNPERLEVFLKERDILNLTLTDDRGLANIYVEADGKVVESLSFDKDIMQTDYNLDIPMDLPCKDSNGRVITVHAVDFANNEKITSYTYFLDTMSPDLMIGGIENGSVLNSDATISGVIYDDCPEYGFFTYELVRKIDDESIMETITQKISDINGQISIPVREDGRYSFKAYAYDLAGNSSNDISFDFCIDRMSPVISITGTTPEVDSKQDVSLAIDIGDSIYENCRVNLSIIRKKNNESYTVVNSDFSLESPKETRIVTLKNDGDYYVKVTARDGAGNEADKSMEFRIDQNAPYIKMSGLNEGQITSSRPSIRVGVKEAFYDGAILETIIYKQNENGQMEPVSDDKRVLEDYTDYKDILNEEEGIYELVCRAKDRSGNASSESLRFTVDYTPPVIGKLTDYDGKYFNVFSLPENLSRMVKDASKVKVTAYVNDKETEEGSVILEEGKYVLWVEAVDEADNASCESATFMIDRTKPQIVVTGISETGNIKQGRKISVGLFDQMDILDEVVLNGRKLLIDNETNMAYADIDDCGEIDIQVKAHDLAGNETDRLIHTSCYMQNFSITDYVKSEKIIKKNISKTDDFDIDINRVIIGVFTMLAGTYGLVFRGLRAD